MAVESYIYYEDPAVRRLADGDENYDLLFETSDSVLGMADMLIWLEDLPPVAAEAHVFHQFYCAINGIFSCTNPFAGSWRNIDYARRFAARLGLVELEAKMGEAIRDCERFGPEALDMYDNNSLEDEELWQQIRRSIDSRFSMEDFSTGGIYLYRSSGPFTATNELLLRELPYRVEKGWDNNRAWKRFIDDLPNYDARLLDPRCGMHPFLGESLLKIGERYFGKRLISSFGPDVDTFIISEVETTKTDLWFIECKDAFALMDKNSREILTSMTLKRESSKLWPLEKVKKGRWKYDPKTKSIKSSWFIV